MAGGGEDAHSFGIPDNSNWGGPAGGGPPQPASAVARLRPRRPIAALSHNQTAVQQMALEWGVTPILMPEAEHVEDLWSRSLEWARKGGVVDQGDRVVLTAGTAVNLPGSTNLIKVDVA